jgi:hypothetical protein
MSILDEKQPDATDQAVNHAPRADEISWTLPPALPLEDMDVLALTESESLAYVRNLQNERRIERELNHAAFAEIARLTVIVRRQTEAIRLRFDLDRRAHDHR